jgi:hypothetical protein
MSLSYTIPVIDGLTGADVTVPALDQTKLQRSGVGTRQNGTKYASYVYNTSDPAHPITVTVEVSPVVKGRFTWSMALSAWALATESTTGAITYRSISRTVIDNLPSDLTLEVADYRKMVDALYALSFKTLTAKVPDTVVVATELFQAAEVW